jgi:hypothetical protein
MDDDTASPVPLVGDIERASCRQDMAKLLQCHTYDEVNQAWRHVSPVQRAALSFVRNFDGSIAHDLDGLSEHDVFPGK